MREISMADEGVFPPKLKDVTQAVVNLGNPLVADVANLAHVVDLCLSSFLPPGRGRPTPSLGLSLDTGTAPSTTDLTPPTATAPCFWTGPTVCRWLRPHLKLIGGGGLLCYG